MMYFKYINSIAKTDVLMRRSKLHKNNRKNFLRYANVANWHSSRDGETAKITLEVIINKMAVGPLDTVKIKFLFPVAFFIVIF
jgi:hypothetical protein